MGPFTQAQLAAMYVAAMAFNDEVEEFRQNGGDPAVVWNDVYDSAGMVFAIWRKKRGGYGCMLVKGVELCERIIASGVSEPVGQLAHAVPSAEPAMMMAAVFDQTQRYAMVDTGLLAPTSEAIEAKEQALDNWSTADERLRQFNVLYPEPAKP